MNYMRVVSGEYKGRPLKAVPGSSTRPTTDKVKEAIFNIIGPYYDGGTALDLFGGSGGLGIEALSRGMDKVIFVDRDKKAVATIHQNLETCRLGVERAEVYRNDAERALKAIVKRGLSFDLILLDPPYKNQKIVQLIEMIEDHGLLKEGGIIMAEHGVEEDLPDEIGNLVRKKHENYGVTSVSVYEIN